MSRLPASATISVNCTQTGMPRHFRWGRQRFVVDRIADAWRVDTDWWLGESPISRQYYMVTTAAGALFVIFYDRLAEAWFIEQSFD